MNNHNTVNTTRLAETADLVNPTVNKLSSVPYNNYTRKMKKINRITQNCIWFCMNCVAWGLTAVLAWSFILAAFHVTGYQVPQWLMPF